MTGRSYAGAETAQISFPLGGIGAGCVGLAGNGRLVDWEILNRPGKGCLNGLSHFAVRAERGGRVLDARVLQGDLPPPYTGEFGQRLFTGFGWGPRRENLAGMPHFREHVFRAAFPTAEIGFGGEPAFPGEAVLRAWSPFIPGREDDSGAPAAFFEVELTNRSDEPVDFTVAAALSNPFPGDRPVHALRLDGGAALLTVANEACAPDSPEAGRLALATDAPDTSGQAFWYRGRWADSLEVYWRDLLAGGRFRDRTYGPGSQGCWERRDTGHLAAHAPAAPGASVRVRFVLAWHVPNRANDWSADSAAFRRRLAEDGVRNAWRNWYATRWRDAEDAARWGLASWDELHGETVAFRDALFATNAPAPVVEAVAANLSILRSATCLRLEDGTFYGWEGVGVGAGSCEGSCTHVWGYEQALAYLFPRLERSMREATLRYGVDEAGGCHFRLPLPLGVRARTDDFRPAADGHFGEIVRTYRDWRLSGETDWMSARWPAVRRMIAYAWSPENPDRWDPERTGVLHGRQHHTLDMELFGPSAWLTGIYLAALKAAAAMAEACGDPAFAAECRAVFARGKAWVEAHLFDGEVYGQAVDLDDRGALAPYGDADEAYWGAEHGEIKYQVGAGVEVDMTLGQWFADLCGLGEILDPARTASTLRAVFRHNFRRSHRDAPNPWRLFALNDEAGLCMCSWPEGRRRPAIPLPYAEETMHGFEYAVACQLIARGLRDEGLEIVRGVRDRYDGERRNPWNEIECGSNYARSLASFGLLHAFSGFRYDAVDRFLALAPAADGAGPLACFWSTGAAWGLVRTGPGRAGVEVLRGELVLEAADFGFAPGTVEAGGETVARSVDGTRVVFAAPCRLRPGRPLRAGRRPAGKGPKRAAARGGAAGR